MASYHAATIAMVAAALSLTLRTPREIQLSLAVDLHRTTVRSVLLLLVRDRRALAEGDVLQMRYCLTGKAA